jgi:hypothetical protein
MRLNKPICFVWLLVLLLATGSVFADQAAAMRIVALPESGKVRVSGIVDKVKSDQDFMLRDATGKIHIRETMPVLAPVAPGSRVTVTGMMHNGLFGFGRKIEATDVTPAQGDSPRPRMLHSY